jgi:hypothetical protein
VPIWDAQLLWFNRTRPLPEGAAWPCAPTTGNWSQLHGQSEGGYFFVYLEARGTYNSPSEIPNGRVGWHFYWSAWRLAVGSLPGVVRLVPQAQAGFCPIVLFL